MSDIVTIESAEYGAEERRLKADPIIVAMARGVPAGVDMTSWEFVSAASRYYVKEFAASGRDTGQFGSIGGPARAIRALKAADGTATAEGVAL